MHKIFNAKNSKILIIELLLIIILLAGLIVLSIEKTPSLASKSDKILAKNATAVKMVEKNETNASVLSELKQKSEVAKAKFEEGKKQDELADKIAKKLEEVVKINETNDTSKNDPKRQRSSQGWLKLNIFVFSFVYRKEKFKHPSISHKPYLLDKLSRIELRFI